MSNRMPQLVIMFSGAVLMVFGAVLVAIQFQAGLMSGEPPPSRSIAIDPQGRIDLATTYIGAVIIAMGVFLEMVGYLATLPWRRPDGARAD